MFGFTAAIGSVDGANVNFTTNAAYQAGSLVVFVNGQAATEHATELGGNSFTLADAPPSGAVITVYFEES